MWFDLDACELAFCDRSQHRIVNEAVLPLDAGRAFDLIASAEELGAWLQDFVACGWISAPPHGVGSERVVELRILQVKERFIAWDRGERLAFTMVATTLPLFTRAVEDLQLTSLGPASTRVRWTVHYELPLWMRLFHVPFRAIFARIFRLSTAKLEEHAKTLAERAAA